MVHQQDRSQPAVDNRRSLSSAPELPVALFSFLLHFVWEFLQVPTYAGMAEMARWLGFWTASLVARTRHWMGNQVALPVLVFLGTGIVLTVGFEFYYTQVTQRWTYSDLMPLVPPFGTGLSPLLQWMAVPLLVLWLSDRHLRGIRHVQATP